MRDYITYVNIRFKNYLKLPIGIFNSPRGEAVPYQALAIAIIKNRLSIIGKKIKKDYSFFSTVTVISSSILTTQCNESPSCKSNNFKISCGTTDLIELGPPLLNFVLYSRIGIPPYLFFLYNILSSLRYINIPFIILIKGYYNNLYIVEYPYYYYKRIISERQLWNILKKPMCD